jgi:hypothetical protein
MNTSGCFGLANASAQLAKPSTMLTCKGADFVWESRQDRAFQEFKARLTERPLLTIYSVDAETEVHTDASKTGLGGILFQKQKGNFGNPLPILAVRRQKNNAILLRT